MKKTVSQAITQETVEMATVRKQLRQKWVRQNSLFLGIAMANLIPR